MKKSGCGTVVARLWHKIRNPLIYKGFRACVFDSRPPGRFKKDPEQNHAEIFAYRSLSSTSIITV